jgi:hypothetical protein
MVTQSMNLCLVQVHYLSSMFSTPETGVWESKTDKQIVPEK